MLSNASNRLHKEYPGFCNSTEPGAKEELATEFHRKNTENSILIMGAISCTCEVSVPLYISVSEGRNVNLESPTISFLSRKAA